MVILRPPNYPEGDGSAGTASGHWGNSYPANLDDNTTSFLGLSREDRQNLATLVNCESVVYVRCMMFPVGMKTSVSASKCLMLYILVTHTHSLTSISIKQ